MCAAVFSGLSWTHNSPPPCHVMHAPYYTHLPATHAPPAKHSLLYTPSHGHTPALFAYPWTEWLAQASENITLTKNLFAGIKNACTLEQNTVCYDIIISNPPGNPHH